MFSCQSGFKLSVRLLQVPVLWFQPELDFFLFLVFCMFLLLFVLPRRAHYSDFSCVFVMSSFNFTVLLHSVKAVKLAWAFVRLSHFCCNKTWCTPFSPSLANQISTRPRGLFSFGTSRETCAYQNAHQCLLLLPPPQSASLDCAMKKLSRMSNRVTLNIVWCSDLAVRRESLFIRWVCIEAQRVHEM